MAKGVLLRYKERKHSSMGRPETKIDKEEFEKLCEIQCTTSEIACWFRCSRDTVEEWVKNHYTDEQGKQLTFKEVVSTYKSIGKVSLRRAIWREAVDSKVPSLLIWKAKQHLGESENPNATENEMPTINFNVNRRSVEANEKLKKQAEQSKQIEDDPWAEFEDEEW